MIQFDEHIFQMGWNHQLVLGLGIRTVDGNQKSGKKTSWAW